MKKLFLSVISLICMLNLKADINDIITSTQYSKMFPNLNEYALINEYGFGNNSIKKDLFIFKHFIEAANSFEYFCNEGSEDVRKRELAAFLANTSHTTGSGWGSYVLGTTEHEENNKRYDWGYCLPRQLEYYKGGSGKIDDYSDFSEKQSIYYPVQGISYHGRGPMQLSWNYNYGKFSEDILGDKNILLKNPNMILEDGVLFFQSAIWFWMTSEPKCDVDLYQTPSCHNVMVNKWNPTHVQSKYYGVTAGFPFIINVINGCHEVGENRVNGDQATNRLGFYLRFCDILGVKPIDPKWEGFDKETYSFFHWNENSKIHKQLSGYFQKPTNQHYKNYGKSSIHGVVKIGAKVISRLHLKLYTENDLLYDQTITLKNGSFKFKNIPKGIYSIKINSKKYNLENIYDIDVDGEKVIDSKQFTGHKKF